MPTVAEVEKFALDLAENERAVLAARLLESLPATLQDEDEGVEEALRRDADFERDPNLGITREEFNEHIKQILNQ